MDGRGFEDFARREIEGFFRRRGERWKFYCASCQRPRPCIGAPPAGPSGGERRAGMTVWLGVSLLLAVIGVVLWIEGGPHPRTGAAWLLLGAILIVAGLPALLCRLFC
jgi:hypothetical protein